MTTTDAVFASFLPPVPGNAIDFSKSSDVTYTPNSVNQYTEITRNSVPKTMTYDDDGNLLADETLSYTWNAENRLIGVQPAGQADGGKKLEFTYDYMGRRVEKKVFTSAMDVYTLSSTTKYIYDGWNLIAEFDENENTRAAYVWGLDLSRSVQGAGGVGGLLARVDIAADTTLLYLYDGNGNVERLLDAADGSQAAVYKYDPYGNLISQAGLYAEGNPFRFSTKYFDGESGLYYYGHRYYLPELGRWLTKDPIAEQGGLNLYAFVGGNPVNAVDPMGLRKGWGFSFHPFIGGISTHRIYDSCCKNGKVVKRTLARNCIFIGPGLSGGIKGRPSTGMPKPKPQWSQYPDNEGHCGEQEWTTNSGSQYGGNLLLFGADSKTGWNGPSGSLGGYWIWGKHCRITVVDEEETEECCNQ